MVQYVALSKQYLIPQRRMCTDLQFIYSTGGYLVLICTSYISQKAVNESVYYIRLLFSPISYLDDIDMLKYTQHLIRTILLDFLPLIHLFYLLYLHPIFIGYTGKSKVILHQSLWYLIVQIIIKWFKKPIYNGAIQFFQLFSLNEIDAKVCSRKKFLLGIHGSLQCMSTPILR